MKDCHFGVNCPFKADVHILIGLFLTSTHSGLAPCGPEPAPLHSNTNHVLVSACSEAIITILTTRARPFHYTRKVVSALTRLSKPVVICVSIDKQGNQRLPPDSFIHPPLGMPHLPLMDPTMRPPSFSCHPPFSSSSVTWVCPFCVLFCRHPHDSCSLSFELVSILPLRFLYLSSLSLSLLHCSSSLSCWG